MDDQELKSKDPLEDNDPIELEGMEEFSELTTEINQNLNNIRNTTDRFFKKKLMIFCVRWTITLVLLYLFIDTFPWIKYLMYAAIPLGLLNLILIFVGRKTIDRKLSDTEDKIRKM